MDYSTAPSKNVSKLIWLIPVLFLFNFLSAYPGGMTTDTIDQFDQSLSYNFTSHHPPVMAMVWSVLNKIIYPGPQVMLFLQLGLIWSGAALMFIANKDNKFRFLYIIIPLIPFISNQSGIVWKDIHFSSSFFFVFAVCYWFDHHKVKRSLFVFVLCLIVAFYGMAVKFQAQYILPILIYYMIHTILKQKIFVKICGTIILSFVLISCNSTVIDKYSMNSETWQLRYVFGLAAIARDLNDDSILPEYVREYEGYNFEVLKKNFTHCMVNTLFVPEDRVYVVTLDKDKLIQLNDAFYRAIVNHPYIYIKHRVKNFILLLKRNNSIGDLYMLGPDRERLNSLNIHNIENNYLKKIFTKFTHLFPYVLSSNIVAILIILCCLYFTFTNRAIQHNEKYNLLFVATICVAFSSVLFIITLATDYRYYFFVRLMTCFTLPIILHVLFGTINTENK